MGAGRIRSPHHRLGSGARFRKSLIGICGLLAPHPNPPLVKRGEGTCQTQRRSWGKPVRHIPFAPFTGRRCRQADEGLRPSQRF
ncbi:hypothetical protein GFM14_11005 [Rhizobium leguminosarum bv. viciae]|nr:hypothetical protein [Rhizobium leguminosarum bv. viciae]NKK91233.1 hypothetical protein [Rhizobium leguminosarum bv. viciae]